LHFIDAGDVAQDDLVIDLRSLDEAPISPLEASLRFTPEHIEAFIGAHPPTDRRVVLCCHSGVRAWRSARQLQARGYARLALIALAGTAK
jgi:rhodanese-related sulfurtransferase